ncbi:DUF4345 domain-containing protein [Polaribacter dokdonensis]|uniref:DUF4345 domain-containing protein n=1 Tax=Polaribacter dokdonensis DSW-5 TaxID=1300348 RepID=A0A0N0CF12_9FLAO|nr:DUF4345 domain-containing protein [Polaribacter dokdonensis]KOY51228.1 hypothetical protein I602_788 [Polaribacter dokdonensis DSW-5]SEE15986.1 protein of unknown function [Polaribacter dokdonensis DSW-5]
MLKTKQDITIKIHLLISVCIVIPVAFVYGFKPSSQFEIYPKTLDELNAFKAIMGLYLGFATLWILGTFKPKFLTAALITNMIFMLGLGFGRVLSFLLDGSPTFGFLFGMYAELILGFYGLWVLTYKNSNFAKN